MIQEDIDNEIRAIRRICTTGSEFVVQVYADWQEVVNGISTYFVVMELCACNLGTYLDRYVDNCDFWTDWFLREA